MYTCLLPVIGFYRLPEAICCLQPCSVTVVLLLMCCMCIPVFIVTSADIKVCIYQYIA